MLSQKHRFVALALLLVLTGLMNVSAQTQQKPKKDKEYLAVGPKPVVQLSEHPAIITPCGESPNDALIPLTATVTNFSTTPLRYQWRVSGGRLNGEGANATWDLAGVAPGTYNARVEVDNNRDDGCVAFTSTKIVIRPCPPPPILCPSITISGPDTILVGAPVTFNANVSGGTPGIVPIYTWTVSAGTILSGQGTTSIAVDTTGLSGQSINAELSVGGFNLNCAASYTVQIPRKITSTLVDYYPPLARDDEKARLDNFAIQLQNDPSSKGYVIVYGGPKGYSAEKQKRIKRATEYLILTRGIDSARIVTMEGGVRDQPTTELWIVPLGADPPSAR